MFDVLFEEPQVDAKSVDWEDHTLGQLAVVKEGAEVSVIWDETYMDFHTQDYKNYVDNGALVAGPQVKGVIWEDTDLDITPAADTFIFSGKNITKSGGGNSI